ncbi:MAG: GerMN domain-containing protein, partial [Armatimonadetes bacterium]|nr:GerMN domain-containing protein [Armatimonadota bacterium]
MSRLCAMILAAAALLCASAASADTVGLRFYLQDRMKMVQREVPAGKNLVEAAVRGLVEGPTVEEKVLGYTSAIPGGTTVLGLVIGEESVEVSLSAGVLAGFDEGALELIYKQFTATLGDFPKIAQVKLMYDGKLLSEYLPPAPTVGEPAKPLVKGITASGLGGRNITIGPSHGRFWNGSGWYWQRSDPCGFGEAVLEDTNSIRLMQFLYQYLTQDGATVHVPRQLNESHCCNPYEGLPYWKMAAYSWLRSNGLPCSVWASYTGNCGEETAVGRSSDDIRARPLFADYRGSEIYIAHHTNAGGGTGMETFRDTAMEHPEQEAASYNLALAVHNNTLNAIYDMYDGTFANRGVKDSAGGFGEIRIPNRPACLVELAFHDKCDKDALYLMDDFFRSVAMWGMYNGICSYFGTSPTWGKYSDEFVSDTIPATMTAGQSYSVSITFRNRGVLWREGRAFRLGAVGDSDPFTGTTRRTISGDVRPGNTYTFTFTMTAPATPGVYTTDWRMVRDGVAWFGATCSKNVTVNSAVIDTEPPTVPTNLQASAPNMTQVNLTWSASTDNVGVAGYKIYRNGTYLTSVTGTSYSNTGLSSNTPYSYAVSAYDGSGNESAQCAPVSATTWALIYQDGVGSLSGWTADVVADGSTRGLAYDGGTNHGSYTGAGSATATVGTGTTNGCLSYRGFAAPFTSGRYEGYFYDSAANNDSRQGMFVRGYNGSSLAFSIYIGTYSAAPGSFSTYSAGVFNGSAWVWNGQIVPRAIGWHKYQIDVLPSGSGAIKFYIDDALKASQDRFGNLETYGISRNNIGHNYSVNQQGWFDDLRFSVPVPNAPVIGAAAAQSASSIRWSFTDASDCESAFSLQDGGHVEKGTAGKNASYIDEGGLAANTQYTRHIHARNGTIEGQPSASASRYTLSVAPTTSTVACDRASSTAYADPAFVFTAVGGFGAGKVQYYRYAWDQSPTHAWTGSETQWSAGTLPLAASSAGSWYLHVRGYNAENAANGSLDLGPYVYAEPTGTIAQAKALSDGQQVALAAKTVTANFGGTIYVEEADGSSGIRVEASGPAVGNSADVAGVIQTNANGERYVAGATAVSAGAGVMPFVPMMSAKHLGGGALNAYTIGVTGGIGVNNIGLLVSVAGKITHDDTGFAYVDDGSLVQDGSGW